MEMVVVEEVVQLLLVRMIHAACKGSSSSSEPRSGAVMRELLCTVMRELLCTVGQQRRM